MSSSVRTLGDQLQSAMYALQVVWDRSYDEWNDGVRRSFEATFVQPLQNQAQKTREELDRLGQVITQAIQQVR